MSNFYTAFPFGTCQAKTLASDSIDAKCDFRSNVNCVVHNIIVGSLWMEQQGTMEITNQTTKHRCVLSFKPGKAT